MSSQSAKIPKNHIQQSLQALHKKIIETPNQPIEIKKISYKSMFSTSKVKRRQKFVLEQPNGICRLNSKS
jgi:hypothetical protein